jgi:hypothetical protein
MDTDGISKDGIGKGSMGKRYMSWVRIALV